MTPDVLKHNLLDCVEAEKEQFTQVADAFYDQKHRSKQSYIDLCKAVIDTVDRIAATGDLTASSFLKNTFEPLQNLQAQARVLYEKLTGTHAASVLQARPLSQSQTKCFISLYQNNGHNLKQWALQLASIDKYMMGRPIYREEEEIQKVLRLKLSQSQEAYVVAAVEREAIVEDGMARQDCLGNPLLTLPMGSVKAANILEFVHVGRRYRFFNNELIAV